MTQRGPQVDVVAVPDGFLAAVAVPVTRWAFIDPTPRISHTLLMMCANGLLVCVPPHPNGDYFSGAYTPDDIPSRLAQVRLPNAQTVFAEPARGHYVDLPYVMLVR